MQVVATQCWKTTSAEETRRVGICLGQEARAGDFIACCGALGAGKTTFTQGFAEGLGVRDEHYVRSPTFTLMHEYYGRLPLYHLDFYRLVHDFDVYNIGFEDYLERDGVVLVEWADKFPALLPAARLHIEICITSPCSRWLQGTATDTSHAHYLRRVG